MKPLDRLFDSFLKKKRERKTSSVFFRCEQKLSRELERQAEQADMNVGEYARRLLKDALEAARENPKIFGLKVLSKVKP